MLRAAMGYSPKVKVLPFYSKNKSISLKKNILRSFNHNYFFCKTKLLKVRLCSLGGSKITDVWKQLRTAHSWRYRSIFFYNFWSIALLWASLWNDRTVPRGAQPEPILREVLRRKDVSKRWHGSEHESMTLRKTLMRGQNNFYSGRYSVNSFG